MKIQTFALLSFCMLAALLPTPAMAADACSPEAKAQQPIKLGPVQVERCYVDYPEDEKASFKSIESYYGQVLMAVNSGVDIELNKGFGRSLAQFFGVKEGFSAVITVSVYVTIAGENILAYEKPIYSISRENNGKTRLSATILGGNGIAVSPTFALDGTNAEVHTQLKVALVNSRKLDALAVAKDGINLAQLMGGPASLVTTVGEPAFLAVASRIQSSYEAAFSDEETTDLDTILKFDRSSGLKGVEYRISFPVPKGQPSTVKVNLSLTTRESLLTAESSFRTDAAGTKWPDAARIGVARWADKIMLSTRTAPGVSLISLSTAIDKDGVPQKLEGLILTGNTSDQISRIDAVNKSCDALSSALQKAPYRLAEADAQLILFNEMSRGRVFDRFAPGSLTCIAPLVPIWKARYNLEAPPLPDPNPAVKSIPWMAKEARLTRMAKSWEMPSPELRSFSLGDDFVPRDVHVVVPTGFIAGALVTERPPGHQEFDVAVKYLAMRKKACFGNFKPNSDADLTATAFVRFEEDPNLYLVIVHFDDRAPFVTDPGPRVAGMNIRVATATDKTAYNQSGSCL